MHFQSNLASVFRTGGTWSLALAGLSTPSRAPHRKFASVARWAFPLCMLLIGGMVLGCSSAGTPGAGAGGAIAATGAGAGGQPSAGHSGAGEPVSMGGSAPSTGGSSAGGTSAGSSSAGAAGAGDGAGGAIGAGGTSAAGGASDAGGTNAAGTAGTLGASGAAGAPQAGAGNAALGITKDGEVVVTQSGVTIVSFGGYLNGESFQQEGIITFNGYQYAAWWNTARHVVLARRQLPTGTWASFEFTDYTNTEADAHNTISIGICAGDGTIHLTFDHHVSTLHYRKSVAALATNPSAANWAAASFSAVTSQLVANNSVTKLTYPRFLSEPGGNKMLFDARLGVSSSGDEYLWEYDGTTHTWQQLGRYIYGTGDSINAYPHGFSYGRSGTRLYVSWCWRETPDAQTNHDLLYIYSDDNGRTWKNNAGTQIATTGSAPVTKSTNGINVWPIKQNRGLINSEHMAIDGAGRVHVLLSHMPDSEADDANFDQSRTKSQYFHYLRDTKGTWTRSAMNLPAVASFRGKLAVTSQDNVYAILPDLRITASSAASNYGTWALVTSDTGRFFSDPLIDSERLLIEDKLSIFYPQKSSSNISVLDYTVH